MEDGPELILGIDLGTTSVKASLYDPQSERTLQTAAQESRADIEYDQQQPGASEQAAGKILDACETCLGKLEARLLKRVGRIGVAGQMHGCVCWRHGDDESDTGCPAAFSELLTRFGRSILCSQLFTWQDARCTAEFLGGLPAPESHLRLATGHGCATLFWLQRNAAPGLLGNFSRAGTVMDLLVAALCGLDAPVMSVQNAASWGYFNVAEKRWNTAILSAAGFPVHLLPTVVDPGTIVGSLQASWCGIPAGCAVGVAMGDLPCSVLPLLQLQSDAVVNISTSAQLASRTPSGFSPIQSSPSSTVEYFPYFHGQYLAVAAALTGGNALAHLVSALQQLAGVFGCRVAEEDVYRTLIERGLEVGETTLEICPTLFGERHLPSQRACIQNLTAGNTGIGHISRALCRGIIRNLYSMMPREELADRGIQRLIGCGSALLRNKVLMQELESVFQMPVVYKHGGNAAEGAAMAMAM